MTQRLDTNAVRDLLTDIRDFAVEYRVMLDNWFDEWIEIHEVYDGMILPEGWKFLGAGISRHAFLGPDGWVYKIGSEYSNTREVETSQILFLESDSALAFPYAERVTDDFSIIRCEYVPGEFEDSGCYYTNEWKSMNRHIETLTEDVLGYGMYDIHNGNVCFVDGTPVLIDLG